ncbi:MAG: cobalamin-dependent protein [Deltaproteobacteria bacterium]|nr:cobalamin-dependent protein [Deltaproteobacteria bacterium]
MTVKESSFGPLISALLDGDHARAVTEVCNLCTGGIDPQRIVTAGIEEAMARLDEKCTVEHFNLLEIMLAGRAVGAVIKELYPEGLPADAGRHTFLIATLEGDVHELGKNIVKSVLSAKGYRLIDCGKNCSLERLVHTAEREGVQAVLVSGLITSVIPQVRQVRSLLKAKGLTDIKVVAGGAVLKQASRAELQVDYVAQTAFDGAHYLDQAIGGRP